VNTDLKAEELKIDGLILLKEVQDVYCEYIILQMKELIFHSLNYNVLSFDGKW